MKPSSCTSIPPSRSTRDSGRRPCTSQCDGSHKHSHSGRSGATNSAGITGVEVSELNFKERLAVYNSSLSPPRDPDMDEFVQLLALQAFHLPGNNWKQDWIQYMTNNHPVFGICCHNKLHPIGTCTRGFALVGTIIFGLALTNMFYLFYLLNPQFNTVLLSFESDSGTVWTLSTGMLLLWTLGGSIHCVFNLTIWHMAACACCRSGGVCASFACCPSLGKRMIRVFVLCIIAMCALIVLLRVAITNQRNLNDTTTVSTEVEEPGGGINIDLDDTLNLEVHNAAEFQFLAGYLVETVLALFIYYPIAGTILFSGMLACGFKIPVLGGRPYEVAIEERSKARKEQQRLRGSNKDAIPTGSLSSYPRGTDSDASSDDLEQNR